MLKVWQTNFIQLQKNLAYKFLTENRYKQIHLSAPNYAKPDVTFLWRENLILFDPWAKAHGYKHNTPTGFN
jgi:hypothetical protein